MLGYGSVTSEMTRFILRNVNNWNRFNIRSYTNVNVYVIYPRGMAVKQQIYRTFLIDLI